MRSILNAHVSATDTEFALSHVQGPMANKAQSTWRQYLRRVATYTCLCFGLANAREIGESSYPYSEMEWLRIYNAASKRGGLVYQNYYLSVGSMTVMVEKNDDAQATDRNYDKFWKRGLMSGIGGTIVDKPSVRKEKDELAGKFRFGKTILITDLNYKCHSNSRGTTNIQYGLDELGYVITVIDINSFKSVTRAQKFLDAVEHLIKGVMPDIATEENVTICFWVSFAFLITDTHPYHVWVERNYAERFAEAIRSVDKLATRPIFVSLCKDPRFHGIRSGIQDVAMDSADILRSFGIMVTTDDGMWRLMYCSFFSSSLADVALWLGPYMSISGKTSLCTRTKTVWKCRQITTTTTAHNPARRPANPPARLAFRQEKQQTRQTKGAGAQTKTTTKKICQRTQWFDHCIILKNMRK